MILVTRKLPALFGAVYRASRALKTPLKACMLALPMVFMASHSHADEATGKNELPAYIIEKFGTPPAIPTGELSTELKQAVETAFGDSLNNGTWGSDQTHALQTIANSGDPRIAWLVADLSRFVTQAELNSALGIAAGQLLDITFSDGNTWGIATDHLMAWNVPEPPDYLKYKSLIFTSLVPGWEKIFVEGDIDWRHVSWGGVLIDDRAYGTTDDLCNCIPAADNPELTDVAGGNDWLDDDDVVFGVHVNGESRAYPRQIMEVREMVNDTLGGRSIPSGNSSVKYA